MYTDNKISALSAAFHKNEAEPVGFVYDSPREKRVILGEDAQQDAGGAGQTLGAVAGDGAGNRMLHLQLRHNTEKLNPLSWIVH